MIQRCLLPGLFILTAAFFINPANATPPAALVGLGDSAYAHKKYDSAEYYYREAASRYNPDAVVLYKLGNAHYRLGHTGEAVLAYERALQLSPGFANAAENIRIIQGSIQPESGQNDVFFVRWWAMLTSPSRSNTWAVIGILCFCIPLGVLIWSRFRQKWPLWLWPHLIVGGIALSLFFAVLSAVAVSRAARDTAVIMRQGAVFRMDGKTGNKTPMITLPEGLVVKVLRDDANALRIVLPDGREGLVQPSDIAIVK